MTLPALLSLHGVHVPRYVTVDGRIVFGDVVSTDRGFTHPGHGTVTPVPKHTFHGHEDPVDIRHAESPWWSDQTKLARHLDAMKEAFPTFKYLAPGHDEVPYWIGEINTGRGIFTIGIFLRHDEGLPFIKVLSRQRLGRQAGRNYLPSPHLYLSGHLCVAAENDWNSQQHTAATAAAWAAHWLACFTEWRITMKWPVPGVEVAA